LLEHFKGREKRRQGKKGLYYLAKERKVGGSVLGAAAVRKTERSRGNNQDKGASLKMTGGKTWQRGKGEKALLPGEISETGGGRGSKAVWNSG